MTVRSSAADPGMGRSFIVSTVIHLAVFLLLAWYGSHHPPLKTVDTYYVDIVNLPVASPQAGSPSLREPAAPQPAPPAPKAPAPPMTVPAKPAVKQPAAKPAAPAAKQSAPPADSSAEFSERMAKLERAAEAKQAEATLARLREKQAQQGSGRAGMPAATGREAGSDYTAYIQSRLKDAFQKTISHTSQNPEMAVRLFIDTDGRLSRRRTERSSGDRSFEISVMRAIDLASDKLPPPPNRKLFEGVFVFKREGILPNRP